MTETLSVQFVLILSLSSQTTVLIKMTSFKTILHKLYLWSNSCACWVVSECEPDTICLGEGGGGNSHGI